MKKETMKYVAGMFLFYILIILGVIIINARFEYLNNKTSNQTINLKN